MAHLAPNDRGQFHEEQLQYGIASYLLAQQGKEVQFEREIERYKESKGSRASYEEGVVRGLKQLEADGVIISAERTKLSDVSFRAAQLDQNKNALYDDRDSANDKTIAAIKARNAASLAEETLRSILTSNTAPSAPVVSTPAPTLEGGFLWKPVSEKDKRLVVLLPTEIPKQVSGVAIYTAFPATVETLVE